jgi:type IV pilus assembly protein PilV
MSIESHPKQVSAKLWPSSQRGFTLLEILIAVLILAIGLLGVAGLQILSLKNSTNSVWRAEATQLAYDILDRVRANYEESSTCSNPSYEVSYGDTVSASDCQLSSANCNQSQMRDYDLSEWLDAVANLPGGEGEITMVDDDTGALCRTWYTIKIRWQEKESQRSDGVGNVGTPTEFIFKTQV